MDCAKKDPPALDRPDSGVGPAVIVETPDGGAALPGVKPGAEGVRNPTPSTGGVRKADPSTLPGKFASNRTGDESCEGAWKASKTPGVVAAPASLAGVAAAGAPIGGNSASKSTGDPAPKASNTAGSAGEAAFPREGPGGVTLLFWARRDMGGGAANALGAGDVANDGDDTASGSPMRPRRRSTVSTVGRSAGRTTSISRSSVRSAAGREAGTGV